MLVKLYKWEAWGTICAKIAMESFQFCVDDNFALEVQWIPRSEIDRADYISRFIDVDDWQISACFASLDTS